MAIIKTIGEVKSILPRLLSGLSNNALMPNMDVAAEKHLVPLVGSAFYTQIETAYTGQTLTPEQQAVLPKLQVVVATGAFLDELPFIHNTITDQGIRSAQTQSMPRVFGWEYKELRNGLATRLFDGIDTLLQYLVAHTADFPAWANSDAAKQFDACIIKTATEFNNIHRLVQPFRTFYALKPLVLDVQERQVIPGIGKELFDRFNTATDLSDDEKIIRQQLKKAVAFYTIAKACTQYAVQIDHNGFAIIGTGDDQEETQSMLVGLGGLLKKKMDQCKEDAGDFLALARFGIHKLGQAGTGSDAFKTALAASPLVNYTAPRDRDTGNSRRKIFRV